MVLRFSIPWREISVAYNKVFILWSSPGVLNTITSQAGQGQAGCEHPLLSSSSTSNWAGMLTSQHNYNVCYHNHNHNHHNHQQWEIMNFVLMAARYLARPASWRPAGSGIIPMFCVSKTGKSISCLFLLFVSLQSPPVTKSARNISCLSGMSLRRERVL